MRKTFVNSLIQNSRDNKNIYLLTADLGFKLFDEFRSRYSDRFFNIGISEANMIGIAAGISLSGKIVYCYSIIPFLIMRAFEQIRVDIAYQNLNVKLIGVGGGFTYGLEGFTHFGIEDLCLIRTLPNMTVVVPADPVESNFFAQFSLKHEGPMYIRLGKSGEPRIHEKIPDIRIGKALIIKEGKDLAIFAMGSMVYKGLQIVDMLSSKGFEATLINMHTLQPFDFDIVKQVASQFDIIFSIEEHSIYGGLGSSISEVLAENGFNGRFSRIGISMLNDYIGDTEQMLHRCGLSVKELYNKIYFEMRK